MGRVHFGPWLGDTLVEIARLKDFAERSEEQAQFNLDGSKAQAAIAQFYLACRRELDGQARLANSLALTNSIFRASVLRSSSIAGFIYDFLDSKIYINLLTGEPLSIRASGPSRIAQNQWPRSTPRITVNKVV